MAKQATTAQLAPTIRVGPGRMSFPAIFAPKENEDGKSRYECNLLLPPGYDTKPLLDALEKAAVEQFGEDRDDWPEGIRKPEDVVVTLKKPRKNKAGQPLVGYEAGWTVVAASHQKNQPGVVDANRDDVTDEKEVYGGRWARISVRPYAYTTKKGGVSLALLGVQVLKHDKPFGGAPKAKDLFDEYADEADDDDVI